MVSSLKYAQHISLVLSYWIDQCGMIPPCFTDFYVYPKSYNFALPLFVNTFVNLKSPKSIPVMPGIILFAHSVASVAANASHGTSGPSNSCSAKDGKFSVG